MSQSDLVPAQVVGDNYHFRGQKIRKGRVIQVTKSALEAAKNVIPPDLVPVTPAEAKAVEVEELPGYQTPPEDASPPPVRKNKS